MKKLLLLVAVAGFAFTGCGDKTDEPGGGTTAPETYTQKALLEYFSGTWCQYCPDGKVFSNNLVNSYGASKFGYVVYHIGDNMNNPSNDPVDTKYAAGYPTGMINRIGGKAETRSLWNDKVSAALGTKATCGLAVDASSKDGANLTVKVKLGIGPADMAEGNYFLTVLVAEDVMTGTGTGWDQKNAYNTQSGHPYAGKGNPIVGYEHTNVVRNILTTALGDELTADQVKAGALSEFEFTTNLGGYGDDLTVYAFIAERTDNLASPGLSSSIINNVQFVAVGENKDFD